MLNRAAILAVTVLLLTGCDSFHSINRIATLHLLPTRSCMEGELKSVPGMSHVKISTDEPWCVQFRYDADFVFGNVRLMNDAGKKTVEIYALWLNHVPDGRTIAATRALMDKVQAALSHCPEFPPPSAFHESTTGIPRIQ